MARRAYLLRRLLVAHADADGSKTATTQCDERPVEIQFHSELSQAVKDENHVDYELERDWNVPYADRAAAHERMTARSNEIPVPAGLGDLISIGGSPLVEKIYPNPYSMAHDETEEMNR